MIDISSILPVEQGECNIYNNTCPSCGRNKLSVSRKSDGTILFNCFRQSCGLSGKLSPQGVHYPSVTQATYSDRASNPYTGDIVALPSTEMEILNLLNGFQPDHFAIARPMWNNYSERVAFPIFCPRGTRQGWCLRSYKDATPKALTYLDDGASKLSHYRRHDNRTAWLVEDIPSAVRASVYVNAVSLLGTTVAQQDVPELMEFYDKIVVCLDADAVRQAIALRNNVDLMFKHTSIVVPPCDLKNMSEPQLEEFLCPNVD